MLYTGAGERRELVAGQAGSDNPCLSRSPLRPPSTQKVYSSLRDHNKIVRIQVHQVWPSVSAVWPSVSAVCVSAVWPSV